MAPVSDSVMLTPLSTRRRSVPDQNAGMTVERVSGRSSQATKSWSCFLFQTIRCRPSFIPYVVEQQLGPIDYVVSTPDRRKTKRVCHVNLLKAYHERDPRFVTRVLNELVTVAHETVPDETKASPTVFDALPELPPEKQAELKAILTEFADVFPDKPGKTTLGVHHIELLPNTQPIRSTPYRLHPQKREFLRK